jgi:hypothetical protein
MKKLIFLVIFSFINSIFPAHISIGIKPEDVKEDKKERSVAPIPNVVADDKHRKLRHYPLTRGDNTRAKSHQYSPGQIRFLHPSVSQITNIATLPEYRLYEAENRWSRCKSAALASVIVMWGISNVCALIMLSKLSN